MGAESRVRENRMHGLMREGRREPVLYSTQYFPNTSRGVYQENMVCPQYFTQYFTA